MTTTLPVRQILHRHTHLVTCLTAALALGAVGAGATDFNQPQSYKDDIGLLNTQLESRITGLPTDGNAASVDTSTDAAHSVAATRVVTNCNDSGAGSLRETIAAANSGDIIDLSGLGVCGIELTSSIVTSVNNLTLQGAEGMVAYGKYPVPIISGQSTISPLRHTGTGALTIRDLSIVDGVRKIGSSAAARGGCLYSNSEINLYNSVLKNCKAENTAGGAAEGGAVAAIDGVTLGNSKVLDSTAKNSGSGSAAGGGIWSLGDVSVIFDSAVTGNKVAVLDDGAAYGGGIFTPADTIVAGSTIANNSLISSAARVEGAGMVGGGACTVKYSDVNNNQARSLSGLATAGGISCQGAFTLTSSTVADNEAIADSGSSRGGGIVADGNVSISRSTISGNTSQRTAGLIMSGMTANSPLQIVNSTISGNVATRSWEGAGIFTRYPTSITNSTITGNIESNPSDNKYGAGLSIYLDTPVELSSTIIAANYFRYTSDELGEGIDIAQSSPTGSPFAVLTGSHNYISGTKGVTWPPDTIGGNTNLHIGPLADNGGYTWTHALLPGSHAIDAGIANGLETDQRGSGYARVQGASADIGAFEYVADVIFANGFD